LQKSKAFAIVSTGIGLSKVLGAKERAAAAKQEARRSDLKRAGVLPAGSL
jgi:hypothetical protein